jgi:hypothetical protein
MSRFLEDILTWMILFLLCLRVLIGIADIMHLIGDIPEWIILAIIISALVLMVIQLLHKLITRWNK